MALSLGSSFLFTVVMSKNFKVSGVFFVKVSLVSFEKQKSLLLSTLKEISPVAALSEGKFFTNFLTVTSGTILQENFLFILLVYFKDARLV